MENQMRSEAVKKYCEENTEPVQNLCPRIVQFWRDNKNNKIYWDSLTGLRCDQNHIGSELAYISVSVKSEYYGLYVEYIKELDALEISTVILEGNRGVDGVKKKWKYGVSYRVTRGNERMFIFKGTTTAYDADGYEHVTARRYYNDDVFDHLSNMFSFFANNEAIYSEFKQFAGKELESFFTYHYNVNWQMRDWYQKYFVDRKKNTKNFLLDYDLEDEEIVQIERKENAITFTKLNDEWCVLRLYTNSKINWENHDILPDSKLKEIWRIYIDKKGKCVTASKEYSDEWKITSSKNWAVSRTTELIDEKKFLEWEPLKYILPVFDHPNAEQIVQILRHPVIEKLIKAGYPKTAKMISRKNEVAANLKKVFGVEREKKLPLYKMLGVNKEIMRALEAGIPDSYWNVPKDLFAISVKDLYGRSDVSDLSKETVELLAAGFRSANFEDMTGNCNYGYRYFRNRSHRHCFTDDERKLVLKLCKAEQKREGYIRTYTDLQRIYSDINNAPQIDVKEVRKYEDLVRLHDELLEIKTQQEMERRARYNADEKERYERMNKSFDKLQEERIAKFEYEDDAFCIRMPKSLAEIQREGVELSHCVAGYREKHAYGDTNIIFLRRKEDETKAFYTIEIKNGEVIQIHGKNNRWLGNNPEAIPFMYQWLQQLGVKYDKRLLLNKGVGYSASSDNLDESYLVKAA